VLGLSSTKSKVVHFIDFRSATQYRDKTTKQHFPNKPGWSSSLGTIRYQSDNASLGKQQSRRDDLEALGYVIMYFLRGGLPWQDLKRTKKLIEKKRSTSVERLCEGYPR
jgi:casein kinase 1